MLYGASFLNRRFHKALQLYRKQLRVIDYVSLSRVIAFFIWPSFSPVPAGDPRFRLLGKDNAVEIEPNLPRGAEGFQTDIIGDSAEHGIHSLLRLPHNAQRPGRHGFFASRAVLLSGHNSQDQSVEESIIQIFRAAENHVADLHRQR